MPAIFTLNPSQIEAFFLIFTRIGCIQFTAPVFSSDRIPLQVRAGIGLLLAFLLQPIVAPDGPGVSASLLLFGLLLLREVAVGLLIGYVANLIFAIVQMAGEIQDTQSGFGFAGVVDPTFDQNGAILGQFQLMLMWLIFLSMNGHHLLLQGIADSFTIVPLGQFTFTADLANHAVHYVTTLMLIAIRIAAPIIGAVLLADLAMGALQRTAPQLNIIAVGFQVKITIAVMVMMLALPFINTLMRGLPTFMSTSIHDFLAIAR